MSVTLARTVRRGVSSGTPLPDAFRSLAARKIQMRRGQLHMLAGKPGSLKTMFMLEMVKRMHVPTLYQCNDSDEATIAARLLAPAVNRPTDEVAREMQDDPDWAASILSSFDHIRWSFDSSPTLDDLSEEVDAFGEIYGEYPHFMVLDILKNVSYYEDSEHGSAARKLQYLHQLGRTTGTGIMVVHHCSEGSRAELCPSRSDILEKQNELPTLQLTVAAKNGSYYVAPVKNRHGPDDATGRTMVQLRVRPETCQFWEF